MTDASKTIALVGATGGLGSVIAEVLLEKRDVRLRALVRPASAGKLASLCQKGVEIIEVDPDDETQTEALVAALDGVFTLVSALGGGPETIVGTQTRLLDAARRAKVRRFIPSTFSYNVFGLSDGENINTDDRRTFARVAEGTRGDVEVVHLLIGAFLDRGTLFGFLGAFDLAAGQAFVWGDGEHGMDFTTYADTARFTAEVAVDEDRLPSVIEVAGDTLTFRELVRAYEDASGNSIAVVEKGSLADLDQEIERRREAEPQNIYAWLPLMYWRGMLSGKGKLHAIANHRFPGITPQTVKDYVQRQRL